MQARIDELYATKVEQDEAIASITAERYELLNSKAPETNGLRTHFESLTTHLSEMFELYSSHDQLLKHSTHPLLQYEQSSLFGTGR